MTEAVIAETHGMPELSAGFASEVQQIEALALFAKALPGWVMENGKGVKITIECGGPSISVDIGLSQGATSEQADDLLQRLRDWEKLDRLGLLIDEMRNVGVSVDIIDQLVNEAEDLARRLSPPDNQG